MATYNGTGPLVPKQTLLGPVRFVAWSTFKNTSKFSGEFTPRTFDEKVGLRLAGKIMASVDVREPRA